MPRSNALVVTFGLLVAAAYGFAGCGFAPAAKGGAGASSGSPLGTAAASGSGTGLVGGGNNQSGHAAVTGMNCASVQQPLAKEPPDILIIQDASGSMNNDISDTSCGNNGCGATSKWAQMTPAINMVVQQTQGSVNWGLKFFADTDATCGVGNGVAVPIAANNANAIAAALMGRTSANGGVTNGSRTPTRLAENAGAAYMKGLNDPNPRFILLATDGLPNCAPGNSDTAADDSSGAVMAVAAAEAMGIPTFVVGVATGGMGTADKTLSDMANAGGYPRAGSPTYYNVSSTAEFVNVLMTLVGVAASCTFTVPDPPNSDTDRAHIGVIVNGTELPHDATNGWDYTTTGMTAVQVFGPQCDAIKNGTATSVQIVFKCIIN